MYDDCRESKLLGIYLKIFQAKLFRLHFFFVGEYFFYQEITALAQKVHLLDISYLFTSYIIYI